jgi:hypothetical protein
MISADTAPGLSHAIYEGIKHGLHLQPTLHRPAVTLPTVYFEQKEIGWGPFLEGFHHIAWQELQQEHYRLSRSWRTGRRWQVGLIKQLWGIARELWEERNEVMHKQTNTEPHPETIACDRTIRCYFQRLSQSGAAPDNYLWSIPLEDLIKKSIHYKKEWIR